MLSAPIDLTIEPRGMISRLTVSLLAQRPIAGLWVAGMLVMIVGAVSWHLKRRGRRVLQKQIAMQPWPIAGRALPVQARPGVATVTTVSRRDPAGGRQGPSLTP